MIHYLDDIEADFRSFYGLTPEDVLEMTGPHFLALAWRCGAYSGAVAAQMRAQDEHDEQGSTTIGVTRRHADTVVEGTQAALASDDAFAGIISFGTG